MKFEEDPNFSIKCNLMNNLMESIHAQIPQTMNIKNKFMISNNVPIKSNSHINSNTQLIKRRNDSSESSSRYN